MKNRLLLFLIALLLTFSLLSAAALAQEPETSLRAVNYCNVTVSVLGDEAHNSDEDGIVHGLANGNLITWLEPTVYQVEEGSSVWDVLVIAFDDAGIECEHRYTASYGSEYISALTFDGIYLAEKGNGVNSGWMYTLNGEIPELGVSLQTVASNDVIVFFFSDDYTKEDYGGMYDDVVFEVEDLIDDIGEVSLDSADAIADARAAYDALTEKQQQNVSNYDKLVAAEARLEELRRPPVIESQPAGQNVTAGEKATFTVAATGEGLTYQWQVNKTGTWNNCTSTGSNKATFSFTTKASYSGWKYRCVVSNANGSVTSNAANLTVEAAGPAITKQPANQNVTAGSKATFTVTATGESLTYQWQVNKTGTWNNCTSTGSNKATFSFTTKASYSGWKYRCVVSNANGSVTSNAAKLTVGTAGPAITKQPANQTVTAGGKATFTVTATGEGLTYQWQVNKTGTWNDCTSTGYDKATFSFTTKASYTGWQYRCIVSNAGGSVTSNAAKLTVGAAAPSITKQPAAQSVTSGAKATFTVTASGSGLTYQWQVSKDGGSSWSNCSSSGYNTASMTFTAKSSYSGWRYRCKVSNSAGTVTSSVAQLTVTSSVTAPTITKQPADQNPADGFAATFTVTASGSGLTYQWQVSKDGGSTWKNCTSSGYNTKTLSFTAKSSYSGWRYRCKVSNSAGTVISSAALLTISATTSGTVYWAPTGTVYHSHADCQSLSDSVQIYSGTIDEAIALGRSRLCSFCSKRDS